MYGTDKLVLRAKATNSTSIHVKSYLLLCNQIYIFQVVDRERQKEGQRETVRDRKRGIERQ